MESKEKFTDFLDRMNTLLQDCEKRGHIIVGIEDIKSVFPELAESDDERIRKDIITYIQVANQVIPQFQKDKWITWLEKQGELSICNIPSREVILAIWDLGNEWKELTNGSISTEYGTQLDYIQEHWHESEYYLKEKQGDKSTDSTYSKDIQLTQEEYDKRRVSDEATIKEVEAYKKGLEDAQKIFEKQVSKINMSIKEKAHQIAWETSKHYDPLLSKESWCEMAALDMASWLESQNIKKGT